MRYQPAGRGHRALLLLLAVLLVLVGSASPNSQVALGQDASTVNVELVLDSSGSMAERIGGETRMQIAKRVLTQVVDAIPERPGINVGFRIYGHRGDNTQAGRAVSCRSSELLVPVDGVEKADIEGEIRAARPTGWTPLAYSIGRAARDFTPPGEGEVNAVVLVTDGLETCGGDPCAVSGALHASDVQLITHVVSFAQSGQERRTLRCVADNGGGLLLGADNADQLSEALFTILEELNVVSTTGFLEMEAFGDLWPAATATCTGVVSDADPAGERVVVSLADTNIVEVPVGDCQLTWTNPSGTRIRIGVTVEADRVTWVRGSVIEFPQGAGERYQVTDAAGIRVWDGPFETGDRIWVLPGVYRVELSPRTGDPILVWARLETLAGSVTSIHAGTEP
jgi:hypothetical protein